MGKMGSFEKFFVNKSNENKSKRTFALIGDKITLSTNSETLEVGAGKGALSGILYEHYQPKTVMVTDYDPAQLEKAKDYLRVSLTGLPPNIDFKVADILQLPFKNESFDIVFAIHVFHHLEKHFWQYKNIPQGLNEVQRVLRKNGYFIYAELFNKQKLRKTLHKIGFEEVFVQHQWKINDFCIYRKKN